MGYIVIQKKDKEKMAAMVEDILYTAGDLMRCVEELKDDSMGERMRYRDGMGMRDGGNYGNRGGYDNRGGYGNRDWDDEDMGERRRRRY